VLSWRFSGTMTGVAALESPFARNPAAATYYEDGAAEYDDWYLGVGQYAERDRPDCHAEVSRLVELVAALAPARTLDVACGTGFLTRHLRGDVVGLDQSDAMLALAGEQAPDASFVQGDALELPFGGGAFERVFASYFYCHLEEDERVRFLSEARRIAPELVMVASTWKEGAEPARYEERVLQDGTRWQVFKRVFRPEELVVELGGGEILHAGHYFLVVRSP
jgi:ubiquinone/menaquinone biosynthesis C-methylase UbiE